jgi:CBS domain-containing protein
VYQAIEIMAEKRIGVLLVLDGGKLVGIVSELDYARKVILKGRSSRETSVREIMAAPVIYVRPADSVDDCMKIINRAPDPASSRNGRRRSCWNRLDWQPR